MNDMLFSAPAMRSLKETLDLMTLKQQLAAHNIANAETEGFVPRRMEFRRTLEAAMRLPLTEQARTAANHQFQPNAPAQAATPIRMVEEPGLTIEDSLVDLVEASYMYQASAKLLAGQYGRLHEAIRGRMA